MDLERERRETESRGENDAIIIAGIYGQSTDRIEGIDGLQLARMMAARSRMEWCMSPFQGGNLNNADRCAGPYGLDLTRWIDEETHYLMNRREKETGKRPKNEEEYLQLRTLVCVAATQRAITLFSEWKGNISPPEGVDDRRNLRTSLRTESVM